MFPAHVVGLIKPGDRKSVQPTPQSPWPHCRKITQPDNLPKQDQTHQKRRMFKKTQHFITFRLA